MRKAADFVAFEPVAVVKAGADFADGFADGFVFWVGCEING
jgi:hypothetical protein